MEVRLNDRNLRRRIVVERSGNPDAHVITAAFFPSLNSLLCCGLTPGGSGRFGARSFSVRVCLIERVQCPVAVSRVKSSEYVF